ncbi:hypothetical protein Q8A73_019360 [Channa argus]|nr:hypothetical protein Q8A73_019360 [Channa argus]
MRKILDELQKLDLTLKRIQHIAQIAKLVAAVTVAVGTVAVGSTAAVLLVVDAPFEFVAGLQIKISAGVFMICYLVVLAAIALSGNQKQKERECSQEMEEFRTIVASLNSELEDVKTSCAEIRRGTTGAEALKFIRLEINILELFAISADLRTSATAPCMTEVVNQYNKMLGEFEAMKKRLQTPNGPSFREGSDTEMTLFNIFKLFMSRL